MRRSKPSAWVKRRCSPRPPRPSASSASASCPSTTRLRAAIEWFRANGYAPAASQPGAGQSVMSHIAIIAALPGELKPLVANGDWHRPERNVWTGTVQGHEAVAIVEAWELPQQPMQLRRLSHGRPDMLISYGWTGALTCALKPPGAYAITEIVDHATGERFGTHPRMGFASSPSITLRSADEKRTLAERHQAVLVDMEAATVARLRRQRQSCLLLFQRHLGRLHRPSPRLLTIHLRRGRTSHARLPRARRVSPAILVVPGTRRQKQQRRGGESCSLALEIYPSVAVNY